jgi:hypothetical protein
MSVCKRHLANLELRNKVVSLYRKSLLTMEQVAEEYDVGHHTVCAILKCEIPEDELRQLKALKYSESKRGYKNPMKGKVSVNYKGDCSDGKGYLTRVVRGRRYFVHRLVFAEMLGIPVEQLPGWLEPHHIDENPLNNSPENLALCTRAAHKNLHYRYAHSRQDLVLKGLSLAEAIRYMTLR